MALFFHNLLDTTDHPLAKKQFVTMEELLPYPIIRYKDKAGEIQTRIDHLFQTCQSNPETLCYMSEEITMAGLISSGHRNCIAIVPDLKILRNFNIKRLEINHNEAYRKIYMAVSNKHPMPPCVKTFFDFAVDYALHQQNT